MTFGALPRQVWRTERQVVELATLFSTKKMTIKQVTSLTVGRLTVDQGERYLDERMAVQRASCCAFSLPQSAIGRLLDRTEVLETRDKLCTATELVTVEGDPLALNDVVWGAGRNSAVCVTGDGATAGVAHARYWYALDLVVSGTATDHLATM